MSVGSVRPVDNHKGMAFIYYVQSFFVFSSVSYSFCVCLVLPTDYSYVCAGVKSYKIGDGFLSVLDYLRAVLMPFRLIFIPFFCKKKWVSGAGRALRGFGNGDFGRFLVADFVRKRCCFFAVRASRGCDKGLIGVQRRPCCNAIRAPLEGREGLAGGRFLSCRVLAEIPQFVSGWVTAVCENGDFFAEKRP